MSDHVSIAAYKNVHLTENPNFLVKTWSDFEIALKDKKLILYGINELPHFLWMRCESSISIVAAIDNNPEKQGHILGKFYDEIIDEKIKSIKVEPKKILSKYNPEEIVILINSFRYYEEIAKELDETGFHYYFSSLHLEIAYRECMKENDLPYEDWNEHLNNYSKKCAVEYPIQNNKIIFSMGTYIEQGKYITEALLKMNKDLDIVWVVNKLDFPVPNGVRAVYAENRKKYVYEMETAKMWVFSVYAPSYLVKREEQIYIFTKHRGNLTLKKSAFANFQNDGIIIANLEKACSFMDYITSSCDFDEMASRQNFHFKGKFLRVGSPKSDILFSPEKYREKVYKKYNLDPNIKILMYAPTFRNNSKKNFQEFKWLGLDFDMLLNSIKNKWGGEWKILLRLHPAVKTMSKEIEKPDFVIDASDYADGQELVTATDVMISDYSTIMFESSYIMRPIFLYAPDKDDYQKNDRDFYMEYESLPFPISTTNEELAEQIKNFNETKYKKEVQAFLDYYGVHEDGHSSERLAKVIIDLIS